VNPSVAEKLVAEVVRRRVLQAQCRPREPLVEFTNGAIWRHDVLLRLDLVCPKSHDFGYLRVCNYGVKSECAEAKCYGFSWMTIGSVASTLP
jgi:hypothetical protein